MLNDGKIVCMNSAEDFLAHSPNPDTGASRDLDVAQLAAHIESLLQLVPLQRISVSDIDQSNWTAFMEQMASHLPSESRLRKIEYFRIEDSQFARLRGTLASIQHQLQLPC